MSTNQGVILHVKDYHLTIPEERLEALQQALTQAARAGQGQYPFKPQHDLKGLVLVVWGFDLYANQQGRALTLLHIPSTTSLQTFDTFLSIIAPFVAMSKPAYFDIACQTEEGDREFFYHFESGKVIKEERITMYVPAELEIKQAGSSLPS